MNTPMRKKISNLSCQHKTASTSVNVMEVEI